MVLTRFGAVMMFRSSRKRDLGAITAPKRVSAMHSGVLCRYLNSAKHITSTHSYHSGWAARRRHRVEVRAVIWSETRWAVLSLLDEVRALLQGDTIKVAARNVVDCSPLLHAYVLMMARSSRFVLFMSSMGIYALCFRAIYDKGRWSSRLCF